MLISMCVCVCVRMCAKRGEHGGEAGRGVRENAMISECIHSHIVVALCLCVAPRTSSNFNAFMYTSLLLHTHPPPLSYSPLTPMHALVPRSPLATQSYRRVCTQPHHNRPSTEKTLATTSTSLSRPRLLAK